ncbi:MAG: ferritin family protein, partial [Anaerolineae bacterium]
MSKDYGIEEALDIAMAAELKARAFYAQAAVEIQDPRGRDLLSRLAAFEQHHYDKLAELQQSLQERGEYVEYAG